MGLRMNVAISSGLMLPDPGSPSNNIGHEWSRIRPVTSGGLLSCRGEGANKSHFSVSLNEMDAWLMTAHEEFASAANYI